MEVILTDSTPRTGEPATCRGHKPERDEFAQGLLDLRPQQMRRLNQFVEEECALGLEAIEQQLRAWARECRALLR